MKQEQIRELSLLLLYLTSWEEDSRLHPGKKFQRAWKGHPFEILNALEADGMLDEHRKSKSVVLTRQGIEKAKELEKKYLK